MRVYLLICRCFFIEEGQTESSSVDVQGLMAVTPALKTKLNELESEIEKFRHENSELVRLKKEKQGSVIVPWYLSGCPDMGTVLERLMALVGYLCLSRLRCEVKERDGRISGST